MPSSPIELISTAVNPRPPAVPVPVLQLFFDFGGLDPLVLGPRVVYSPLFLLHPVSVSALVPRLSDLYSPKRTLGGSLATDLPYLAQPLSLITLLQLLNIFWSMSKYLSWWFTRATWLLISALCCAFLKLLASVRREWFSFSWMFSRVVLVSLTTGFSIQFVSISVAKKRFS